MRPRRLPIGRAGILLAVAGLAAACSSPTSPRVASLGSTSTPPAPAASGDATAPDYGKAVAYAQCMRTHGVLDFPDPNAQGNFLIRGGNRQNMSRANASCAHLLPDGGRPTPAELQAALAQALKLTQCMRAHGLANFPDPVVSNGDIEIHLRGVDPQSTQFQRAQRACAKFTPGGGP
jgi:hypothetical protein